MSVNQQRREDEKIIRPAARIAQTGFVAEILRFAPGLALTASIALIAVTLQRVSGLVALSPLVIAILLGIAIRNGFGVRPAFQAGIALSLRRILRLAVVLLGVQLTIWQIIDIGAVGFAIIALSLAGSFVFVKFMGRMLGVERKLTELIAAGTSVCGASAVIATNTVTRAPEEDVAYAIACVTVFGSLAMLVLPLAGQMLALPDAAYGLWAGASIHEVAQVVAASFQNGEIAGQTATVAKLSRVMLLAPLILSLGFLQMRRSARGDAAVGRAPVPWFVFGFIALVLVNSMVTIPPAIHGATINLTGFLLAMALAAMGLETDIGKLRAKGLRPLVLGLLGGGFIALFSLGLIMLTLV